MMSNIKPPSESASQVIERIGLGRGQWQCLLASGGIWMADGAELLLLSSVTKVVQEEWTLNIWQKSLIVSIVYFGVLLGNLASGIMGDLLGRRLPILLSYIGICIFSLLSLLSNGFYSMSSARFLVGISFGLGQPSWNALMGEITPSRFRLSMNGVGSVLFCAGELYSAFLIWGQDPYMQHLNWRWLIGLGVIPSMVFLGLSLLFLKESPSYLMVNGRTDQAQLGLEQLRDANGAVDITFELCTPNEAMAAMQSHQSSATVMEKVTIVLGRHMLYTTLVICFTCFTLNFLFYGGLYAFPQVLPDLGLELAPSVNLMIGAFAEIPGILMACLLGHYMPRKNCMLLYLLVVLASCALFSFAQSQLIRGQYAEYLEVVLQGGLIGYKTFTSFGYIMAYVYAVEVYPTVARTTGVAMCLASGRLGGIVSPLVFEATSNLSNGFGSFFTTISILCAVNAVLILFLPFETKDKVLQDHFDEQRPILSKSASSASSA